MKKFEMILDILVLIVIGIHWVLRYVEHKKKDK
nr:MAG TPA: Rifin [Caudoviricetes sp.]